MHKLGSKRVTNIVEAAIPMMQREFVMRGPLRGVLPADIRADILRVFTQLLCRSIRAQDGGELGEFVDAVVWEARKLGVDPVYFVGWIDEYREAMRRLLDDDAWILTEPMIGVARRHMTRLQN